MKTYKQNLCDSCIIAIENNQAIGQTKKILAAWKKENYFPVCLANDYKINVCDCDLCGQKTEVFSYLFSSDNNQRTKYNSLKVYNR